jgi:gamma-glutamylaminecyclotransferase
MHLFVYGTLKRGQPRNRYLSGQTFVAPARTQPVYRIFNLGDYPGLVKSPDGMAIDGELWSVDEACLKRLDEVEGCDDGLYCRSPVELAPPHDEISVVTYVYQKPVKGLPDCGTRW